MANGNRPNGIKGSTTLLTVLIVLAVLYFARSVFIPLALAILLAFLLGPLVIRLRHWGLGRVPSAVSVVLLSFCIVGVISMIMASQLTDLAHKLPEYQHNVHQKIESVRQSGGGVLTRISRIAHSINDSLTPQVPTQANPADGEKPVPVEIRRSPFSPFELIQKVLGSVLGMLVTAGIVIVFVIFMLIEREDLRDRLLRLAGAQRINVTTKLLDDAAQRVSRYLLAQLVINVGFGVLAGIGLYFLRVPNPFLWAMLAALLRYIPYLGIWIAAIMPAAVALAVDPGWLKIPAVFGMYFGIDLCMYNFAEPLLYGSSTGISPLAILVAAVFWTWLWGPVGLLLATPLTVCVVVIGHHVPNLEFLTILLSDEEVLSPHARFYQRMLAMDLDEATELAEQYLKNDKPLEQLFDEVIVPALSMAEQDRHRGKLDDIRQQFIFQNTRSLVEDLAERADDLVTANGAKNRQTKSDKRRETEGDPPGHVQVLCIPARDEADEIASVMLAELLGRRGIQAKVLSSGVLASEAVGSAERTGPLVAFVAAVPPFGYLHARYLCRRLKSQFKRMRLVAAILTEGDVNEVRQRKPPIPAEELCSSLQQALAQVVSLISVRSEPAKAPALAS